MTTIKKNLAELKDGDVLVGHGCDLVVIEAEHGDYYGDAPVHVFNGDNAEWVDKYELASKGYMQMNDTYNVKAPESADPDPHIVEIDGKQIRVSLVDGQPVAELVKPEPKGALKEIDEIIDGIMKGLRYKIDVDRLWVEQELMKASRKLSFCIEHSHSDQTKPVKPELKPGSWVPLADVPDYTHVYIKALYANGRFANLSQNDELWSDHDSVPHVLIPPAIQTVGAHKSGDMVRLGDLSVGTRVISAVEDRLDRDESEETFVFGHWVDSDRKVELA